MVWESKLESHGQCQLCPDHRLCFLVKSKGTVRRHSHASVVMKKMKLALPGYTFSSLRRWCWFYFLIRGVGLGGCTAPVCVCLPGPIIAGCCTATWPFSCCSSQYDGKQPGVPKHTLFASRIETLHLFGLVFLNYYCRLCWCLFPGSINLG